MSGPRDAFDETAPLGEAGRALAAGSGEGRTPGSGRLARGSEMRPSDPALKATGVSNPGLDATMGSDPALDGTMNSDPALDGTHGDNARASRLKMPASVAPNELLAGRYRIVRQLGQGGMGEVYEAEDLQLGDRVALKTLRSDIAGDSRALERFKREIRLARKVTHPNVCRLFEFGQHRDAGPPPRALAFLTMELLTGRTLADHMQRSGRMSEAVALPLVENIVAGLTAAHTVGIVHRDLKCANIFLVGEDSATRAIVTDFGIAREHDMQSSMTADGSWVGSPAYIAPEQVNGQPITAAADVYSLGVVMFEMVTGTLPFVAPSPLATAMKRLTEPAPSPRSVVPTLDPRWDAVILRCLEREAEDRFASALEVIQALRSERTIPLPRPRRQSRPIPVAMIATALIAAAVGGALLFGGRSSAQHHFVPNPEPSAAPVSVRRTIAVVDFLNQSAKDQAWIATALAEVLNADLAADGALRVTPGADVARMKAELELEHVDSLTAGDLAKIRSDVGADLVVSGRYLALGKDAGGQVRLDVVLLDTVTAKQVARVSETGTEADLIELGSRVADDLRQKLGIAEGGELVLTSAHAALPTHETAARLYADGLSRLRRFEILEARDLLQRAATEEPDDPLIHSALSAAWSELGYDAKSAAEAKLAFDHTSRLPKEGRLAVEAQYHEAIAEWDRAAETYKTLFEMFPDHIDYGLALANARTRAGDAKSAYAALATLRHLPAPLGTDPRIDLADAVAAEIADDFERNHLDAGRAITAARQRGARELLAKALLHDGWTLWTKGRDSDATVAYDEARRLFGAIGDRSGLAFCMNNIALALHRTHQDSEATKTFDEALTIAKDIGDTAVQAHLLNNWGYVLTDQGDLSRSRELYRQQLELLGRRGVGPNHLSLVHFNIAEISRWQGDLADARQHGEAAEELLRGLDARRYAAWTAYQLGEVLRAQDDLAGAHKKLEQAIGWASDTTMPAESAELRISLARIEIAAGQLTDAEPLARTAISDLRTAKESSQLVCAEAVLASALLAHDHAAEAATELAAIAALPSEGVSFACRLEADVVSARVSAAQNPSTAIELLQRARDRAEHSGFVEMQYQIRLALGTIELASGKASAGRAELAALARDASAKDFRLVARQAKQALQSH